MLIHEKKKKKKKKNQDEDIKKMKKIVMFFWSLFAKINLKFFDYMCCDRVGPTMKNTAERKLH